MRQGLRGMACAIGTLLVALGLVGIAADGAAAQIQGKQQQKCINRMNKAAAGVQLAQARVNASCVSDFVLSGGNAELCVVGDLEGKIEQAQGKLEDEELDSCIPGQLPGFAYTDGLYAGSAAAQAEIDLVHDLYGQPVDNGLLLCAENVDGCKCQRQISKRTSKLSAALSKVFLKCKQARLAGSKGFVQPATAASQIATCVSDAGNPLSVASDPRGKIGKAAGSIFKALDAYCFHSIDNEVPGVCGAHQNNAAAMSTCISQRVKCRFCRMIKAVDNLPTLDCAAYSGDATCPL
ncbi:MAG: hypothetical protein SF182_20740 [Deltaproteobacteria bacterium]|nr:hypothetical protein [Deltaproteobacteria bacterium]